MRFKILSMAAALMLVAACSTTSEDSAATTGTGATSSVSGPKMGSQEDLVVNVGDRVFFDFDRYNLKPDARRTLEKQAVWLKKHPSAGITLEGHADERGTREYNLALGERRANSAKDYLMTYGISSDRISVLSYGKERPVDAGSNPLAWSKNRRSVTVKAN